MKILTSKFPSDNNDMKKIFRNSQMKDVLGRHIGGLRRAKLGIPYDTATGDFFPFDPDSMDCLFAAVAAHPHLHIVTTMRNGWTLNRYKESVDKDVQFYSLYEGNADPDIEFSTEWTIDDYTDEEIDRWNKFAEWSNNTPIDFENDPAIVWLLDKHKKRVTE